MRTWTQSDIIEWPTQARPYFVYWRVLSDGAKILQYSDFKVQTGLGNGAEQGMAQDYAAIKNDMARFDKT